MNQLPSDPVADILKKAKLAGIPDIQVDEQLHRFEFRDARFARDFAEPLFSSFLCKMNELERKEFFEDFVSLLHQNATGKKGYIKWPLAVKLVLMFRWTFRSFIYLQHSFLGVLCSL